MKTFNQALLKFQALTWRERLMAVAAVLAVLYFAVDLTLLGPQVARSKALQQQITQQKTELDALMKVMASAAGSQPKDAVARVRAERDELRDKMTQAEPLIVEAATGAPLGELIRAMIVATPGVTLVSLKTLPAEVFYDYKPAPASGAQQNAAAPRLTLYKQGVEVVVKGNYPALVQYLQRLQRSPNRMYWAAAKLDVGTYPDATLSVTIFRLSNRAESPLG